MPDIGRLLELVDEKNRLCREYEQCSDEMLTCGDDEFGEKIRRRSEIARQIDAVSVMIDQVCVRDVDADEPGLKAVRNSCDRDDLPDKYKAVFDRAQAGFACLNRVRNNEPLITDRMNMRKLQLDQKIRSVRNTSNILTYLNTGISSQGNGNLLKKEI